jgi:metabolite-proton symporter
MVQRRSAARVVLASLIGTSLEWYDFFLYGSAAALVFGKLFFPTFAPLTATLLAFTTYAVGFVARPLGGVVFGHFGDRAGRKTVLVVTLMVMGVATALIGTLPTYSAIGPAAPVLLVTLRFVQGIGLGGEWGGAVLMSIEHADPDRRGFTASWPQVGVPAGNLLAAGVLWVLSALLPDQAFLAWGWRVPFLLSAVLVLVGLWVRLSISESPLFASVARSGAKIRLPLVEVLRRHPRELLVAMGARIGTDVAFYTFVVYVLTYVTGTVKLPREAGLAAVLVGSAGQLVLIPLFGALSDRYGRRPVYLAGTVAAAVWAFAFFPLLDTGSRPVIILAVTVALITHAAMYGPQAAFVAELFATELRYSGASMGYQVAGIFGGALAPIIAIKLVGWTGSATSVSWYVAAMLAITAVALLAAPETAHRPLDRQPASTSERAYTPA